MLTCTRLCPKNLGKNLGNNCHRSPLPLQVSDDSLAVLARMTSLLSLNVLGCHRLTPGSKAAVAHLLDSTLDR